MDGENHGSKGYEQMDDLGVFHPIIFGSTPIYLDVSMVHIELTIKTVGCKPQTTTCQLLKLIFVKGERIKMFVFRSFGVPFWGSKILLRHGSCHES